MRMLALGGHIEPDLLASIAWLAGIYIAFPPLAARTCQRAR
jgi:hypothetical protein